MRWMTVVCVQKEKVNAEQGTHMPQGYKQKRIRLHLLHSFGEHLDCLQGHVHARAVSLPFAEHELPCKLLLVLHAVEPALGHKVGCVRPCRSQL